MDKEAFIDIIFDDKNYCSLAYDKNDLIGKCEFEIIDNNWHITHTYVNELYNGRGIAKKLVLKIIFEARKRNIKIVPICSYVKNMVSKNYDEYKDVLK